MSLNTIETARSLSKGPITKEKTQNFLDYIDSNFPNGWEQNSEIRTIVIDFQGKLHNNQEQWAQDAFTAIEASRDQRGVLASSIRPVLRPNTDSINETPELATAKSKLSDIGETPESAALVFEEITNKTPTEAHIREYQEEHRLGIDGIIGIKTFGELQGKRLQQRLNADIRNNSEINTELQGDIIDWFEYANLNAVDAMFLRRILQIRKGELQKTENYDVLYKDFFDQISKYETVSNESEEGQATQAEVEKELHRPDADGRSTVMRIKDGIDKGNLGEEISSLIEDKGPMIIFLLAGAFVFGMIPGVNNTVATNTWWKRLLIGGVALMNKENITDLANITLDGVNNFFNNPETQEQFNSARNKTLDVISGMAQDIQGIEISSVDFNANYEAVKNTFIQRQQALLDDNGNPMIPNEIYVNMHTRIMGDERFLNATTSDILSISSYDDLTEYLSPETITALGFEGNSENNEYVQLFIDRILKPELNDTTSFVGDIFIVSSAINAANEVIAYNVNNLTKIESEEHRLIIEKEFSNILGIPNNSQALQNAAKDLLLEARDGDVSTFVIDNYPSLSNDGEDGGETGILQKLKDKLNFIFTTQDSIRATISEIGSVSLNTREGQLTETRETLEHKLGTILESISELRTGKIDIGNTYEDISTANFNWDSAESAYNEKRLEIIRHAGEVEPPITELTENGETIDVMTHVHELEISSISDSIEILDTSSTPLELENWWNENKSQFTQLDTIASELTDEQEELKTQVRAALAKRNEFAEVYTTVRSAINSDLNSLSTQISAINTQSTDLESYRQARTTLETISEQYDAVLAKILPSWGKAISTDVWTYFESLLSETPESAFASNTEQNSIEYLDSELNPYIDTEAEKSPINLRKIEQEVTETIRNLESSLEVSLDISSIDVTDASTLQAFKSSVGEVDEVLGFILDEDIKDELESQLATQVTQVEELFIAAIAVENITEQEIRALRNIYNTEFKGFLNSNGNGNIHNALRDKWNGGDRVELALDEEIAKTQEAQEAIVAEEEERILEGSRREYFESISDDQEGFESIPVIARMKDTQAIKDVLSDPDEFPITLARINQLLNIWLLNNDLSEFHSDIQITIDAFNDQADNNINN